jgi:hypothetical protein
MSSLYKPLAAAQLLKPSSTKEMSRHATLLFLPLLLLRLVDVASSSSITHGSTQPAAWRRPAGPVLDDALMLNADQACMNTAFADLGASCEPASDSDAHAAAVYRLADCMVKSIFGADKSLACRPGHTAHRCFVMEARPLNADEYFSFEVYLHADRSLKNYCTHHMTTTGLRVLAASYAELLEQERSRCIPSPPTPHTSVTTERVNATLLADVTRLVAWWSRVSYNVIAYMGMTEWLFTVPVANKIMYALSNLGHVDRDGWDSAQITHLVIVSISVLCKFWIIRRFW